MQFFIFMDSAYKEHLLIDFGINCDNIWWNEIEIYAIFWILFRLLQEDKCLIGYKGSKNKLNVGPYKHNISNYLVNLPVVTIF